MTRRDHGAMLCLVMVNPVCLFVQVICIMNTHGTYIINCRFHISSVFFAAERLHDSEYRVAGLCACSAINPPTHMHTIYGHSANTHMRP